MPGPSGRIYPESYSVLIPGAVQPGKYTLKFKLYSRDEGRNVLVALDPGILDEEKYYTITSVQVKK